MPLMISQRGFSKCRWEVGHYLGHIHLNLGHHIEKVGHNELIYMFSIFCVIVP